MKTTGAILFGFVMTVLGCFCAIAQDAGPVRLKQPFSITLTPDPVIAKPGTRIWVMVSIKNLQDRPRDVLGGFFPYALTGQDGRYTWRCTDDSGRDVTKRIFPIGSAHDYLYLAPGKMREETVGLDPVCNLQLPGNYRATLFRRSLKSPNDAVISSNTIAIEVRETPCCEGVPVRDRNN